MSHESCFEFIAVAFIKKQSANLPIRSLLKSNLSLIEYSIWYETHSSISVEFLVSFLKFNETQVSCRGVNKSLVIHLIVSSLPERYERYSNAFQPQIRFKPVLANLLGIMYRLENFW